MNQNNLNLSRQEFKYFVSSESLSQLRNSLSALMLLDKNANPETRKYTITSLYFDTPFEEDFEEKVDGIKSREKFRVRTYNHDQGLIKFESKRRVETVIKKVSAQITKGDTRMLCNADYTPFSTADNDFLNISYAKLKSSGYRPNVIVEYDREAYYLPYGNIRITFDLNLRTYNTETDLLNLNHSTLPVFQDDLQVLEVKHSVPLPSHLKLILSKINASRSAISKFVLAQRYNQKSAARDKVEVPF